MRISDWSSDVCSSDLSARGVPRAFAFGEAGRAGRYLYRSETTADVRGKRIGCHNNRLLSIVRLKLKQCVSPLPPARSEEHTSELQSLMRISYAVFCLKNKKKLFMITTIIHITYTP